MNELIRLLFRTSELNRVNNALRLCGLTYGHCGGPNGDV